MKFKPFLLTAAIAVIGLALWWNVSRNSSSSPPANPPSAIQKSKSPAPVIHPAVAALLTPEATPIAARLATLGTLGIRLAPDDRRLLLRSITNTPPNGLTLDEWYSLANDILQALRFQQPFTPEYTDSLVAFWNDKTLDPTLRDYALQQLREWVADRDTRTCHEERPDKLTLIQQTFLNAVTPGSPTCDPQSTFTGTAMLALNDWFPLASPQTPASTPPVNSFAPPFSKLLSASAFQQLLLTYAADPACHRGVRSTALQLCTRRGIGEALPAARTILADNSSPAILRLTAISLIGSLGSPDDRALLTTFQQQNARDPLLQASLQKALSNLSRIP